MQRVLTEQIGLVPDGGSGFKGNDQQPWLQIDIVHANQDGSFASQAECPEKVNLIAIVGSKRGDDKSIYEALLIKIAKQLNWDLVEEEDEDDNINVIIWSSNKTI